MVQNILGSVYHAVQDSSRFEKMCTKERLYFHLLKVGGRDSAGRGIVG